VGVVECEEEGEVVTVVAEDEGEEVRPVGVWEARAGTVTGTVLTPVAVTTTSPGDNSATDATLRVKEEIWDPLGWDQDRACVGATEGAVAVEWVVEAAGIEGDLVL